MEKRTISFPGIHPFQMTTKYVESFYYASETSNDAHIHDECEIYVNLTGDVSFMVEDRIYPVCRGNAIITRPNEYHHCIYQSNALHRHFWILFSAEGNHTLLDAFFDRSPGTGNLITLSNEKSEEMISLCFQMLRKDTSPLDQYVHFLSLLRLLQDGRETDISSKPQKLATDVRTALEYINSNLTAPFSVAALADSASVSVNTLERHFKEALQVSPFELIKRKRLTLAAELLRAGSSVQEAAMESGFSDSSYFITIFKDNFHMTPLSYKKKYER